MESCFDAYKNHDGKVRVFIDNNVWNLLFEQQIDICKEFSSSEFVVAINREVSFEVEVIPKDKIELKDFIDVQSRCVETKAFFGFKTDKFDGDKQRLLGWGLGELSSNSRELFRKELNEKYLNEGRIRSESSLFVNEADIDLAARSMDSIVLTLDKKNGPLKYAYDKGYTIVFLNSFQGSKAGDLKRFVMKELSKTPVK